MPGPAPKDPATRQRRNTRSTKAALPAEGLGLKRVPLMPKGPADWVWHDRTRAWWRELWKSPMAANLVAMDLQGIERLAFVVDRAHHSPGDAKLEEQIAKLSMPYGLSPLDRRRLEWSIEPPKPKAATAPAKPVDAGPDPRSLLRVV